MNPEPSAPGSKPTELLRVRLSPEEAVRHLGRIGSNLTQLARVANASGRAEASGRLADAIEELHRTIRRLV